MSKLSALMLLALATMAVHAFPVEGSVEAGKAKSATCVACHGVDGNSPNPEWPSLAGQHETYLVAQLEAFKAGERQNVLMSPMATGLSREDMADLAAYFSAQALAPKETDPQYLTRGEELYRGGDIARGITACIACHGPRGHGNPLPPYPAIAGQHATYVANALRQYAVGEREGLNNMMPNIASRMTESDIRAVSAYVQGLR